jgi:signal transduction histidine kinase
MRLADFIELEMEAILSRWEEFAKTLAPAALRLDSLALRDHAEQMLRAIAGDLRTPQTRVEQEIKSRGESQPVDTETAAQTHAVLRATSGFSIRQLVSEYRALRASVLRQYLDLGGHQTDELADVGRFNEAIDQAVAESVDYFTTEVDRWRNIFLGVLSHDLRGPLNAIQLTATLISRTNPNPDTAALIERLINSGRRMTELLDDLLDFNRVNMGAKLDVAVQPADMMEICRQEVELQRSAHAKAKIELEGPAACPGVWDPSRLRQAIGNLVGNAVKYGNGDAVKVRVESDAAEVRVHVDNRGATLDGAETARIFDPLFRGSAGTSSTDRGHLGLGLFIVRQVAQAHGGSVHVHSANGLTRFSVLMPLAC